MMYMLDRKIKGLPITFLIAVTLTIMLTIFFGAWAVSADVDAQDRKLSFGIGGSGADSGAQPSSESSGGTSGDQADDQTVADEWWGRAVLKACPFH